MNIGAPSFEWDGEKDLANSRKHGVSFTEAQKAFLDPHRIIAVNDKHRHSEQRYFCIGKVDRGILTVRFTWRDNRIRIIGAGFWREGRKLYEEQSN